MARNGGASYSRSQNQSRGQFGFHLSLYGGKRPIPVGPACSLWSNITFHRCRHLCPSGFSFCVEIRSYTRGLQQDDKVYVRVLCKITNQVGCFCLNLFFQFVCHRQYFKSTCCFQRYYLCSALVYLKYLVLLDQVVNIKLTFSTLMQTDRNKHKHISKTQTDYHQSPEI